MKLYLTIDIGGTDIKYGIIDKTNTFLKKASLPTKSNDSGNKIINQVLSLYTELKETFLISGISISAAGVIDTKTTQVLSATDTIKNYSGLNFRQEIQKHFPNILVSVENDVNCMALYETHYGNAKGYNSVVAMTIGTGIGGSIVIDNKLYHGSIYSAGEWGRMIIGDDTFEKQASTAALVRSAQTFEPSIKNGIDVFKFYDQNNLNIRKCVDEFFSTLATGITNIVYTLNPDVFVIGGGITERGQPFLDDLLKHLKLKLSAFHFENTKFDLAKAKNDAGMLGAFIHFKSIFG